MERTFIGKSRGYLDIFGSGLTDQKELVSIGKNVFESEDLVDRIYSVYLPLITKRGWRAASTVSRMKIDWVGESYVGGFYLPCTERVVLSGQVDLTNDNLPEYASLVMLKDGNPHFTVLRRMRVAKGVSSLPFSTTFSVLSMVRENEEILCHDFFVAVTPSGVVFPCQDRGRVKMVGEIATIAAVMAQASAVTINAWEDKRHLWQVETSEDLLGSNYIATPLRLGVNAEHVKSLFYARELPVTPEGRRRPILHWVSAHQRRIKDGIDIDISKHLRGISAFEMGGFSFQITNPMKKMAKAA